MIKISVMYPGGGDTSFDHQYYRNVHLPLVKERLGAGCTSYTIDKGLAGGAPGAPPPYVAMCHLFSPSLEAFQAGMAQHGEQILADLANFTTITPLMQISEIVVA